MTTQTMIALGILGAGAWWLSQQSAKSRAGVTATDKATPSIIKPLPSTESVTAKAAAQSYNFGGVLAGGDILASPGRVLPAPGTKATASKPLSLRSLT